MAGLISTMMILFILFFYVNIVSSQSNNTTQFENFTIEWENFNLLTCAVPTIINVSLFTCLPSPNYTEVNDIDCLETISIDFDQNTCQSTTTEFIYTSSILATTQKIIPIASTTTNAHTSITATRITTQSTTPSTTRITTQSTTPSTTRITTELTTTKMTTVTMSVTNHTPTINETINTSTLSTTVTLLTSTRINTTTTFTSMTTTSAITSTGNIYHCQGDHYIGTYCNVSSNACAMSQPCLNGATCIPNNTLPYGYVCQCQIGYAGQDCEYDENACMQNTCWHNGTCIPVNSTVYSKEGLNFKCECIEGYDGVYCELEVDLCSNITCENRGSCETVDLMWKCLCLDASLYYGDYCQFKTGKLIIREILSKSFASIAIGVIVTTCTFVVIMDVLKYAFHIDPVEYERESYRKRIEDRRRARRAIKHNETKFALRFRYVS